MYIKVRVKTGQRKEELQKNSDTDFVLSVRQKPERNMANARILEIFKEYFKTNNIRIISGIHHPIKMLVVEMGAESTDK